LKTDGLAQIGESVRAHLDAKHKAREQALALTREVIRLSANAIRAVHRREFGAAEELLAKARSNLEQTEKGLAQHQDIFHAGFVHDSQKEFAEASTTLALIAGRPLPTPEELGVMGPAYLNGIGETVGELRRFILDLLRHGNHEQCETLLDAMDDIYYVLVSIDYPDAITGGLRRTTDIARSLIERTRGEFSIALVQENLEAALKEHAKRLEARS